MAYRAAREYALDADRRAWAQSAKPSELDYMCRILADRQVAPAIIARVRRLNPDYRAGSVPRGIHYKTYQDHAAWTFNEMGKGSFIHQYGRLAWLGLPRHCIRNSGRRQWVTREAVADQLWLHA